ncbi:hypothetical protein [Noviherbaspirillum aridicola]|uniref:hypothetical protein n=1 Tax=Noviherbaspirillum aridicola TaxID=2849687 RepID=UPI001C7E8C87|nr:hypothetical protein [Noviherbaspirillum aridicola]
MKNIVRHLLQAAVRNPRTAAAILLLMLVALAGTLSYAGFIVVGTLAGYLGTSRFLAGLLLGVLFARIPWVAQGKLRTVGLLPRTARRPVMLALLVLALATCLYRGQIVAALFPGFASGFLLAYPRMRTAFVRRTLASLFRPRGDSPPSPRADDGVIDVEFREKKD